MSKQDDRSRDQLLEEINDLRQRLEEQNSALQSQTERKCTAMRTGEGPLDSAPPHGAEALQAGIRGLVAGRFDAGGAVRGAHRRYWPVPNGVDIW